MNFLKSTNIYRNFIYINITSPNSALANIATKLIIIISIISTLISLYYSHLAPSGFENLWLVPLCFTIIILLSRLKHNFFKYVGFSVLNLILFTRYTILPAFSAITGLYFFSVVPPTNKLDNQITIFITLYEMLCIYMLRNYLIQKLDFVKKINIINNNKKLSKKFSNNKKFTILYVAIILGILFYILSPAIQQRMNFIIIRNIKFINLNTIASIGSILATNVFILIFIIIATREFNRKLRGIKPRFFLLFVISFFAISIIFSTGRLIIVEKTFAVVIILTSLKLMNKKQSIFIIILGVLIVLSLSAHRWFGVSTLNNFGSKAADYMGMLGLSDTLKAYFSGCHLISTAVSTEYNIPFFQKIISFFKEILSSVLFVRQLVPLSPNSSTVVFNKIFGFYNGTSMILPTLGQSFMYFGLVGAPVLSVFFTFLLYKAERGFILSSTIGEKFAFCLLATGWGFFPMQNLNIITATFFFRFLPLYIIIMVNKRIKIA